MSITNEVVAILSFLLMGTLVLVAGRLGKTALFVLSVTYILISNITVQVMVNIFGVTISWAIIVYSMIYLITDIVSEYHGKSTAYRLAGTNLGVQFVLWGYVYLSTFATPTPSDSPMFEVMKQMFGTTSQISLAALVASLGPFLDIAIFAKIKAWWSARYDREAAAATPLARRVCHVVVRNKLSTFVGQCVNTAIFFSIAMAGTDTSAEQVMSVIISACVVKIAIAILDIPLLAAFDVFVMSRGRPREQA